MTFSLGIFFYFKKPIETVCGESAFPSLCHEVFVGYTILIIAENG